MSLSSRDGVGQMEGREGAYERDPEVVVLAQRSLKLVVRAELILHDLEEHQREMAAFLERVSRYTKQEGEARD